MKVVVVGGGWAGLSAAVELCARGVEVTLVEAGVELGGRAREIRYHGRAFDNGQHVALGAYSRLLAKLRQIGVNPDEVFDRTPLEMHLSRPGGNDVVIRAPALPAPFNLLAAVATAKGLHWSERWALLRCMRNMAVTGLDFVRDRTVEEWLIAERQPPLAVQAFWEPLCLAALTTPPSRASMRVFMRVMRDAFSHRRMGSDLLLIKRPISAVFPVPARRFIENHGGNVVLGQRVSGLNISEGRCRGVRIGEDTIAADQVILAVGPEDARRMLLDCGGTEALVGKMVGIFYEPICTVFLRYPRALDIGFPMVGLLEMTGQWLFDHSPWGVDGLIAVVISGGGKHMRLERQALGQKVAQELAERFPDWPKPEEITVFREKRAALACRVDVDRLRPGNDTPIAGLWLAGDYTYSRYPSTLEAAVRSGEQCVERVMEAAN